MVVGSAWLGLTFRETRDEHRGYVRKEVTFWMKILSATARHVQAITCYGQT